MPMTEQYHEQPTISQENKNNDVKQSHKKEITFLKKHWMSMTLALLSFIGAILSIVWIAEFGGMLTFMAITGTLAWMFFFIGMMVYFLCKILKFGKKNTSSMILLGIGVLTTLFAFMNMIYAFTQLPSEAGNAERIYLFVPIMFPLIVIGFFTLFRGLDELIKAKSE